MELIAAGRVLVGGVPAAKPATLVDPATPLAVVAPDRGWVSRGARKLDGALRALPRLAVAGRRCLDAGASTGGFTEVLLERGAREVVAVDVGYGQLAWRLRTDPRVKLFERTNVRSLIPAEIGGAVELTVADLSFISLRTVLPTLAGCTVAEGDLLVLVKPQFELGRDAVASGGVVRDPGLRQRAIVDVALRAAELGLDTVEVVASPLPGPAGNVEYFLWLRRAHATADAQRIEALAAHAVAVGPT